MTLLRTLLEALPRSMDPAAWVSLHQVVPLSVAGLLVGVGLCLAAFGTRPFVLRFVVLVPSAFAGLLLVPLLGRIGLHIPSYLVVAATALVGFLLPHVAIGIGVAAFGGAIGGHFADPDAYLKGLVPGALLGAIVALSTLPFLAALLGATLGVFSFMLGALSMASHTRFGGMAGRYPLAVVSLTVALIAAATAYQLLWEFGGKVRAQRRNEKLRRKQLAAEDQAREERFRAYRKKAKAGGEPKVG